MSELLPCPFCGGAAELRDKDDPVWSGRRRRWYFISCQSCEMESVSALSPVFVAAAWNRRATPSDLAAAKEREAALVAENVKLRELAGRVCNAWDAIGGALETSSDVDDFNECEQATFELRSALDGETS
jgi:Lar family restriction alleviation protein